jgi:alpha-1,3-rhamnosyl/mannosyltransferase
LVARAQCTRLGRLYVLGVDDPGKRSELQALDPTGCAVEVLPFLPPLAYEDIRRRASIVLLPSSHEGFGLPVLEAFTRHQVPVISEDPALVETASDRAIVASTKDPARFATGIIRAVDRLENDKDEIEAAAVTASGQTWLQTWRKIEGLIESDASWECPRC